MADQDQAINVKNAQGQIVSIPSSRYQEGIDSGQFAPVSAEDIQQEKYGNPTQQGIAGLEGLASGVTGGLSKAVETRAFGVKPEDIEQRAEANPITHTLGEIGGLGGSSLIGVGEGPLLEAAGKAGVEALGLTGTSALSKIGSSAVKNAIETGVFQGTDEVAKTLMGDPNQSAESAITNMGLSTLFGGALGAGFGAVSPLWTATTGKNLGGWLEAIQRRANGEAVDLAPEIKDALAQSGMTPAPEILSGLSENPDLQKQFNILQESKTRPGLDLKEAIENTKNTAEDSIFDALGTTKDGAKGIGEISGNEAGQNAGDALIKEIREKFGPAQEAYNKLSEPFSKSALRQEDEVIADKMASMAEQEGFTLLKNSPESKMVSDVMEAIPNVRNMEDLTKLQSRVWNMSKGNPELFYATKKINEVLQDTAEKVLEREMGAKGADTMMQWQLAKSTYKDARDVLGQIAQRLNVGKYAGPETFIHALEDKKLPEQILRGLLKSNDANLIQLLEKEFPQTSEVIKKNGLEQLIGKAVVKAQKGRAINSDWLFKQLDTMTPEYRKWILPGGAEQKIRAIETILDKIPSYKTSGTAGNLDALWSKVPGGTMALVSMIMGHNPAVGWMLGQTAKWASRDAPDAIRLAMLKFLGHPGSVEPEAFKTMVDFIHNTVKGENAASKAAKAIFKAGSDILPKSDKPTEKTREKLDKQLLQFKQDPAPLMNTGGKFAQYMPDHGTATAQVAANAANLLNQMRPNLDKKAPFDSEQKMSTVQKAQWDRTLDIAENPLMVIDNIKNGAINHNDVSLVQQLYPAWYKGMVGKISNEMIESQHREEPLPYRVRMNLSAFLGQPLDSTMTPQAILAAQPTPEQAAVQAQQSPRNNKGSMKNINKMAQGQGTTGQMREMQKNGMAKA